MVPKRLVGTVERLERAILRTFPDSEFDLVPDEEDRNAWGLYVYSSATPEMIQELVLDDLARVLIEEDYALYVVGVPRQGQAVTRPFDAMMAQPLDTPVHPTREQALAIVEAGIGGRPDLPPGTEYVRRIRQTWRGFD